MRRGSLIAGSLLTVALLAAACGDDKGASTADGSSTTGGSGSSASSTTKAPKTGGTLTYGLYSETAGLDPIVSRGSGVAGATEMASIYDTIMRWDPKTAKYVPQTAASLDSNADATEWTLKLKPNIKFSDGTPYDAKAVKFGLDRHRSGLPGGPKCDEVVACPSNTTSSTGYMVLVKDIAVVDDLTVKITLTEPWGGLPYMLSDEPGMIPSPDALKKACTDPTKPISKEGTPADSLPYMSPERTDGVDGKIDARTDLYSLAATLYAMLSGKPPFQGKTVAELIEKIRLDAPTPLASIDVKAPAPLERLLRHCMAKRSQDRPASAAEVRTVLESLAQEHNIAL